MLLDDLLGVVGHDSNGFFPGDAFPLVFAAILFCSLHGIDDAVGVVKVFLHRQTTGAKRAFGDRVLRITFDLGHFPVFDMHLETAADRMASRR